MAPSLRLNVILTISYMFGSVFRLASQDQHIPKIQAFFQGKCTKMSPCHQQCLDLPTGGYECSCWPGYKLHRNGFSCVTDSFDLSEDEDNDFDHHDNFIEDDDLDRLQEVSDLKNGNSLIYPVHDRAATIKRSEGSSMSSFESSNEDSLEELAWGQFIRTKVDHHDLDDLDDLNINLDDIMMGDAPAGKLPLPSGKITAASLSKQNIEENAETEITPTDEEIAALKGIGTNPDHEEIANTSDVTSVIKRRRPKGSRKNHKNNDGSRKKTKNGRRKNKQGNKNKAKFQNTLQADSMMMATNPEYSEETTNHLYDPTTTVPVRFRSCDELRCHAGGRCVPDELRGGVRCQCRLGNTGDYCERDLMVKYPKFMGTGYVAFPVLRGAYKEFSITIQFRPDTQNGLLLFSSEHPNARADFFSVSLVDGYAQFRFDCGTGPAEITTNNMVLLSEWNTIRLYRNDWNGWIQLNDGEQARGRSKDLYSRITFRQDLYLGGYRNLSTIGARTGMQWGFVGCVSSLEVNGRTYDMRKGAFVGDAIHGVDVGECSAHVCDQVRCQNGGSCIADSADTHVCLCPLGTAGDRCENRIDIHVASFQGSSYLQFIGLRRTVLSFTEIEFVFKADDPDGLLMYNGYTSDRSGDFISLGLVNGYLEYRFDLGTGAAIIRSRQPISLHEWHVVHISRTGRDGYMQIDNQAAVEGLAKGAYTQLTLTLDLFIGGHRNFDEIAKNANLHKSFKGCIQKVIVNERPLRLLDEAIDGVNIDNCNHPCTDQPCLNGGRCIPIRKDYKCSCPIGFESRNCEDRKARRAIRAPIHVPMFSRHSFLLYTETEILNKIRGDKLDIQLHIKTKTPDGVILWSGTKPMTHSSDYVTIGMKNGHVFFGFNLGSGEVRITYNRTRLDDDRWHKIRVQRYDRVGYLEIDGTEITEGTAPPNLIQLNTEPKLYIGGMEDVTVQTNRMYDAGFMGCITNVTLATNYKIDLMTDAVHGQNLSRCSKKSKQRGRS